VSTLPEDLEPVRIILANEDLAGWVRAADRRMTDILQSGDAFLFLPSGTEQADWIEIYPDETLLVVPPPHTSPPELRLTRSLHQVAIRLDDLQVAGTAHLRPGEQDDPVMRASRRFLPLTEASFARDGEAEQTAAVVIVNLRRVSEFRAT